MDKISIQIIMMAGVLLFEGAWHGDVRHNQCYGATG